MSLLFPLLLVVTLLLFTTKLLFKKTKQLSPLNLPPGPPKLPFIGNLHRLKTISHQSLWSLSKQYGPLMHLKLGSVHTLVVSSAKHAKQVMKNQDLNFCSRPPLISQKKLSYNFLDVVFAPYGEYWREMRKLCIVELFNTKRTESFGFIREAEVARMVQSISRSCGSGGGGGGGGGDGEVLVNLSSMLMTLTSNIVCRAAFGKRYVGEGQEMKGEFHRMIEETQALFMAFFVGDYLPWLGWVDRVSGQMKRLDKNFVEFDRFYEKVIEEHLNRNGERADDKEDFVDVLLQLEKDHKLTRDHVKGILMNILVAGTDTGAATLTWIMTELIRNPRVMKKVQDEVGEVIGNKDKILESDISQLQYLKMVVKETFRLHSTVPLLVPRETICHCKIDGYDIPPKTLVFVNAGAIGHDSEYWTSPHEFLPERFIDSDVDYKGNHFELIPFGAGRRICPGMLFGTMTVELALANILYYFNWKLPSAMSVDDIDMTGAPGVTVHKKFDLLLVATKCNRSKSGHV